jgi:hypothetical protein
MRALTQSWILKEENIENGDGKAADPLAKRVELGESDAVLGLEMHACGASQTVSSQDPERAASDADCQGVDAA